MNDLYLDFAILSTRGQHFGISTEAHAQDGFFHHHEVILQGERSKRPADIRRYVTPLLELDTSNPFESCP